ncbi:hypothetical protein N7539_004297 [Penicillium diatomitis]|uniref:Uncharacterized protein n=1 Tax=Penicillium diatomitis TaxID=2819901 RepID=A0A9W9XDQ9_9EURO|nr:uncharacterized protein N7539_004297 [Penicillium diatomitis]KAJ5489407.1 hypothetical protein N7539_004297 [Penicillium diatomitis]
MLWSIICFQSTYEELHTVGPGRIFAVAGGETEMADLDCLDQAYIHLDDKRDVVIDIADGARVVLGQRAEYMMMERSGKNVRIAARRVLEAQIDHKRDDATNFPIGLISRPLEEDTQDPRQSIEVFTALGKAFTTSPITASLSSNTVKGTTLLPPRELSHFEFSVLVHVGKPPL